MRPYAPFAALETARKAFGRVVSVVSVPIGGSGGYEEEEQEEGGAEAGQHWGMNGKCGSVAYFIMNGRIKVGVRGRQMQLADLARGGKKTRLNGHYAKILRAQQVWFLLPATRGFPLHSPAFSPTLPLTYLSRNMCGSSYRILA
jgi:hypothetical protein